MCQVINVDPDNVDFESQNWFQSHTWNNEQQEEFKKWLLDLLSTNIEARREFMKFPRKDKKSLEKFWQEFNLMWGWTHESCQSS
jgi:hypothetical protein